MHYSALNLSLFSEMTAKKSQIFTNFVCELCKNAPYGQENVFINIC
jgi:hypothetical protein